MRRNIIFIYIVYLSKRFIFVSAFFVLFLLVCLSVCLSSPDLLVSVFTTACREIFPFLSMYQGSIGRENLLLIGCFRTCICQIWRQNIYQNWLALVSRVTFAFLLSFYFLAKHMQCTRCYYIPCFDLFLSNRHDTDLHLNVGPRKCSTTLRIGCTDAPKIATNSTYDANKTLGGFAEFSS